MRTNRNKAPRVLLHPRGQSSNRKHPMKRSQDRIRTEHSRPASALQGKTRQSEPTESPRKLPADWSEQYIANEFKVVALNERPIPYAKLHQCNDPKAAAEY